MRNFRDRGGFGFAVGAGALAGPGADVIRPHEKRGNAPAQKIPNSSFLILKKLPRRRFRHSGAAGPAQVRFSFAGSGRNGRRKRGMAARVCASAASVSAQVLSPVMGVLRGRGLGAAAAAERRRGTHRARTPLSASLPTFSAWRK